MISKTTPTRRSGRNSADTLAVEHLLHPEAGGGAVEVGQEGEVVVLGGVLGQLDDGRRPVEHLAAAVGLARSGIANRNDGTTHVLWRV